VEELMKSFSDPLLNLAINSPFLCRLPIIKPRYDRAVELFAQIFRFLDTKIEDHINNRDYSGEVEIKDKDYIDAYLRGNLKKII
jgi:hypothetical protein